jgi:hypothetical protein
MLNTFEGGTVKPTSKKEAHTERSVREKGERKELEEWERLDKGAAVKQDEERIVRVYEEAAAAEQSGMEAGEATATAAPIVKEEVKGSQIAAKEAEAARIAAGEEECKKKEEEEAASKSTG